MELRTLTDHPGWYWSRLDIQIFLSDKGLYENCMGEPYSIGSKETSLGISYAGY